MAWSFQNSKLIAPIQNSWSALGLLLESFWSELIELVSGIITHMPKALTYLPFLSLPPSKLPMFEKLDQTANPWIGRFGPTQFDLLV